MRKFIYLFFYIILIHSGLYAGDNQITDACSRQVDVPQKIHRIVAIGPGAAAMTVYADISKSLVAREVYGNTDKIAHYCPCAYPKDYSKMPVVYRNIPNSMPDYDALSKSSPDVVIASGFNAQQADTISQKTGVPVVALNCSERGYMHFDSIIQSLRLTGFVLNKEKSMQEIMNYMMKIRKELYDRTQNVPAKKVFIISETYDSFGKGYTSEKCYTYLKMLNMSNAALPKNQTSAYFTVSKKELMKIQPDYIFIEYTLLNDFKKDYMKNMEYYKKINAFKYGRVYTIMPYNRFSANLENILMNSYYIGKLLYPKKFTDITMHDISDEITEEFTGEDIYTKITKNTPVFRNIAFSAKGIVLK